MGLCVCVETVLQTVEGGITLLTARMSCTLPFVFFFPVCVCLFCNVLFFLAVVVFVGCCFFLVFVEGDGGSCETGMLENNSFGRLLSTG